MGKPVTLDELRLANPKMASMVEAALAGDKRHVVLKGRRHGVTHAVEILKKIGERTHVTAVELPRPQSKLEIRFVQQLAVDGLPAPQRNFFFLTDRDLELDFAWPEWKVGVEINGGAHRASLKMLARDCEKICLGLLAGWVILPLDGELVKSGRGLEMLQTILNRRRAKKGPRV